MCFGRLPQLDVYFVPRSQLAHASLTVRARVCATALAGGYLAAVSAVALVGGRAAAKAAGGAVRAGESVQRLLAARVVDDAVPAAARGQRLEAATVAELGVLVVPWQGEEIDMVAGSRLEQFVDAEQHL